MPGTFIRLCGMNCAGFASHLSSVCAFQTTSEDLRAGEYRSKLLRPPALRSHTSARLGPVMLRSGCTEWHGAQTRKLLTPRWASPAAPAGLPGLTSTDARTATMNALLSMVL